MHKKKKVNNKNAKISLQTEKKHNVKIPFIFVF